MPAGSPRARARLALGALAYSIMDLVARESIRGAAWAAAAPPRGRASSGTALTNAERQRRYRAKHNRPRKRIVEGEL